MDKVGAVVLAAGQGKRMHSSVPKVLHRIAGAPLVRHVLDAIEEAGIKEIIVVIGQGAEMVKETLGCDYTYALQEKQLGTGDAVIKALPYLSADCQDVLVVCGDTPLLTADTLVKVIRARQNTGSAAAILTSIFDDPKGYGRIIRDNEGFVDAIVEDCDATAEQKDIKEINTGTYVFTKEALEATLHRLKPDNQQGEYYLTDCIHLLRQDGRQVTAVIAPAQETQGINNRAQLAAADKVLRQRECQRLMETGVTILDPATTYIDKGVKVDRDTVIYPFTFLEGRTEVGPKCTIGPGCRLIDAKIGEGVTLQYSVIMETTIGDYCQIGPYAYLRPGNKLADHVKVGDFCELKKATVGSGSKIPHLSYIGDTIVGEGVNIGAGTITCNYDGVNKHQTVIEDRAFIGSNTNLVAPVRVGEDVVIGAGSTITKDVPAGSLALERNKQTVIPNWKEKKKRKGV